MSTTIHDVAKKLNISIYTVSRALDGYDDVSERTRQLVIETSNSMGYAPNRAARQLRRQKAETIGFILPSISKHFNESFFTEFISELGDKLSSRKFDLLMANAPTDDAERNLYHRWVNSHKVDGFILNRIRKRDWRVTYLSQWGIPFVALGKSQDGIKYPCIRIDAADAYLSLVRQIKDKGFSRFAFIGGPNNLVNQIDRLKWFRAAITKCKLKIDKNHIISTNMSSEGGYEAASKLLSSSVQPNAILCVNDETAFGALSAAREHGFRVGRELAVAGFEGVRDSRYVEPPLTTLDIPVAEIAHHLVQMLLEQLNNQFLEPQEITIQPELLIRASTGG